MEAFLTIVGGVTVLAYAAIITIKMIRLWRRDMAVAVASTEKSKGVRWAEKRLGHALRQNEHNEYLVCEDELDKIVRSPWRSLLVFLASSLATAVFTALLRLLGA